LVRAWQIAEGEFIPVPREGEFSGAFLPRGTWEDLQHFRARRLEAGQGRPYSAAELLEYLGHPGGGAPGFQRIVTAQVYSPVAHVPEALTIAVLSHLGGNFLVILYAARLASLAAALALGTLALQLMPALPWTSAFLALLPMAVFSRATVAPDAPLFVLH